MMRGFAHDGPLARALLTVAYLFAVSLSMVVCVIPYVLFERLVGWQPTHLAVLMGVAAMLPLGPALFATISAARDLLAEPGSRGAPFRRFWRAFAMGVGVLWWYWALVALLTLGMAYNLILTADAAPILVGTILMAAVAIVFAVALSCTVAAGVAGRPTALLVVAARAVAARPHIALTWIVLIAAAYAATLIPIVGPSLALFAPAAAACGILIVNTTFGFDERMRRHATVTAARAS